MKYKAFLMLKFILMITLKKVGSWNLDKICVDSNKILIMGSRTFWDTKNALKEIYFLVLI